MHVAFDVDPGGVVDDVMAFELGPQRPVGPPIVGEEDRLRIDVGSHGSTQRLTPAGGDDAQADFPAALDHAEDGGLRLAVLRDLLHAFELAPWLPAPGGPVCLALPCHWGTGGLDAL